MSSNQVSITSDLWRRLHDVAEAQGVSIVHVVESALAAKPWSADGLAASTRRPTVVISAEQWQRLCSEAEFRAENGDDVTAHELLEQILTDALDREGANQ